MERFQGNKLGRIISPRRIVRDRSNVRLPDGSLQLVSKRRCYQYQPDGTDTSKGRLVRTAIPIPLEDD